MAEKYIPHVPTPEDERRNSLDALFGFLGIGESPEDQIEIESSIKILRQEIEKTPIVGRAMEENKAHKREFVIPIISHEQEEQILTHLGNLGIFPWEEDKLLIIDRRQDLEKLRLAGLIRGTSYKQEKKAVEVSIGPDTDSDLYKFPLPARLPKEKSRIPKRENLSIDTEIVEAGIDTELAEIIQKWDSGILEEEDEEFKSAFGDMPTLTLFPRRYIWNGKNHTHIRTGEVITADKEKDLLEKAAEGDPKILDEVVRLNIGFVVYISKRVKDKFGGDIDEIFQDGLLGLEYAIRNYHREEGTKFTSYAGKCIEGYMRTGLKRTRTDIYMPANPKRRELYNLKRKEDKKKQLLGPEYDEDEANRLYYDKLSRLETRLLIGAKFDPIASHFNDETKRETDLWGGDTIDMGEGIDENLDHANLERIIREKLLTLTPREEMVIRLRFGLGDMNKMVLPGYEPGERASQFDTEGFTLEEIGMILSVTRDRVRQIEAKGLRKLKHPSRSRVLRRFVGAIDYDQRVERSIDLEVFGKFNDTEVDTPPTWKIELPKPTEIVEEIKDPLNGWMTIEELAEGFKLDIEEMREIVDKYKADKPKLFRSVGKIIKNEPHIQSYFSEELIPIIEKGVEKIEEERKIEDANWKPLKYFAEELGMAELDVQLLALNYRSSNPEWFRSARDDRGVLGEQYNNELVEKIRERVTEIRGTANSFM